MDPRKEDEKHASSDPPPQLNTSMVRGSTVIHWVRGRARKSSDLGDEFWDTVPPPRPRDAAANGPRARRPWTQRTRTFAALATVSRDMATAGAALARRGGRTYALDLMGRPGGARWGRVGVRLVLLGSVVLLAVAPGAAADRLFAPRFSVSTQGDITIAANSLESCLSAAPACGPTRDASGAPSPRNNNDRQTMTWVDVDGDPSTLDSSSADLALPTGATVLFAGLYYGGRLTAGTGGSPPPNAGARDTVMFRGPGDTSYRSLTAAQVDDASTQYQGFVNVTSIVAAAGAGTYTTANVQLGTGLSDSNLGGWALVVVYGDAGAPNRNLSVFDGLQDVDTRTTVTIPVTGLQTPLSGPVAATVGIVAYEGDLATTGDSVEIEGAAGFTSLSNSENPADN